MTTPSTPDLNGITPLMRAAAANDPSRIAELVAEGHDVNAKDMAGSAALIYAVANDGEEAALMLLHHKADTSAANRNGETALIIAAKKTMQQVVERWITLGAPLDAQSTKDGQTALMTAIAAKDIWSSVRLLESGADFDKLKNHAGETALLQAKAGFAPKDLDFFMTAASKRLAARAARAQEQRREELAAANEIGVLAGPVTAPKTASFTRRPAL